jgi:hypothetical protein
MMTNEAQDENVRQRQALTENELKAVAYFSVGKSSEGGFGGRDVSYELRFAGDINRVTRRMEPVGNSGYSIGSLQTDLGQHRSAQVNDDVPTELVDRYQAWARAHAADRPGAQAIDTPVERSSEIAKSGVEAREQKQTQDIAQAQTLNQDGPSGPAMKIGARTIAMASSAAAGDGCA